jgi:hypothetical protein
MSDFISSWFVRNAVLHLGFLLFYHHHILLYYRGFQSEGVPY